MVYGIINLKDERCNRRGSTLQMVDKIVKLPYTPPRWAMVEHLFPSKTIKLLDYHRVATTIPNETTIAYKDKIWHKGIQNFMEDWHPPYNQKEPHDIWGRIINIHFKKMRDPILCCGE